MRISMKKHVLSDRSEAWSLLLWENGDYCIELPAITEEDAVKLRDKLKIDIENHTNETVEFDGY